MRNFIILTIFAMSLSLLGTANVVFAQDSKTDETPITKWIDAENAMIDTLPAQNQKVFFVMRNKYNVIRSVRMVERDIKNAVTSCASENPEISKEIKARFKSWQNAVTPILIEADKFLKEELKEQEAFYVSDFNHVSKLNDKAFKFSEEQIQKKPVSTLKSCNALIKSMNKSENQLIDLLQTILIPEEVVRKRLEREDKK